MTQEQATSEMHYRLCKLLLQNLRENGLISPDEEIECQSQLKQIISPFISILEGDMIWQKNKSPE